MNKIADMNNMKISSFTPTWV